MPSEFEQAYQEADTVVFETDIAKLQTPEFQAQLLEKLTYQDGTTLQDILSEQTFRDVEAYFAAWGIPIAAFLHFRPSFIVITITALELQKLGIDSQGVDYYFAHRAEEDGKAVGQLETVEQQLDFVVNMGTGMEDELIESTWEDISQLPLMMESMMDAWRAGNTHDLEEFFLVGMKKEFPDIYRKLIVKRNNAWMAKIEQLAETEEVEFILVGTGHLVGEDGLLSQLARKGYTIEQK